MELNVFMKVLESSLVKFGVPSDVAGHHVATLRKTFTKEDLADIENIRGESEVDAIAGGIASILNKNKPASKSSAHTEPARKTTVESDAEHTVSRFEQPKQENLRPAQNSADFFEHPTEADKTQKGTLIFWGALLLTLPITLGLLAVILGAFAMLYIGLIVGIIGCIAALIGAAACCGGISLIGIIYGITQLFSNVPAGIYEIGLGVIIAGIAVFVSILLYNVAIRFLPWVMRWLTVFFSFVMGRLKYCFYLARRECYKL